MAAQAVIRWTTACLVSCSTEFSTPSKNTQGSNREPETENQQTQSQIHLGKVKPESILHLTCLEIHQLKKRQGGGNKTTKNVEPQEVARPRPVRRQHLEQGVREVDQERQGPEDCP